MRKLLLLTIIVSFSLLQSCYLIKVNDHCPEEEINRLEIASRRLGTAIQGVLWSGAPPDENLIATACGIDPLLCNAFGNNTLFAKVIDGNAVILVCTPDGKRALVEDIACTPIPDYKAWIDKKAPCEFTIPDQTVHDVCR